MAGLVGEHGVESCCGGLVNEARAWVEDQWQRRCCKGTTVARHLGGDDRDGD
jgi:hypothetical protein